MNSLAAAIAWYLLDQADVLSTYHSDYDCSSERYSSNNGSTVLIRQVSNLVASK